MYAKIGKYGRTVQPWQPLGGGGLQQHPAGVAVQQQQPLGGGGLQQHPAGEAMQQQQPLGGGGLQQHPAGGAMQQQPLGGGGLQQQPAGYAMQQQQQQLQQPFFGSRSSLQARQTDLVLCLDSPDRPASGSMQSPFKRLYQMASSAGSATAGLFSGQPLPDKSIVQQLEDANPELDTVQDMKGGGHQQPVRIGKTSKAILCGPCAVVLGQVVCKSQKHQKACPAWHRKEEFRSWRDAQCAKGQLDPSKAEVTVMIGWLQHEGAALLLHGSGCSEGQGEGLEGAVIFYDNDATAVKLQQSIGCVRFEAGLGGGLHALQASVNDQDGPDHDDETIKSGISGAFWWDFEADHRQVLEAMYPKKLIIPPSIPYLFPFPPLFLYHAIIPPSSLYRGGK
eukprot:356213-Chlamydomonas_euryale.AAC.2